MLDSAAASCGSPVRASSYVCNRSSADAEAGSRTARASARARGRRLMRGSFGSKDEGRHGRRADEVGDFGLEQRFGADADDILVQQRRITPRRVAADYEHAPTRTQPLQQTSRVGRTGAGAADRVVAAVGVLAQKNHG